MSFIILDRRIARLAAAVVSGGLLWFTLGLHPIWLLAWIAFIPLLLAVRHASAQEAVSLSLIALLIGNASNFDYLRDLAGIVTAGILIVIPSLLWTAVICYTRHIVVRSGHWSAVFAFPVAAAALDAVLTTFSPHGTWGSLAYTQVDALPVLQIASIAGTAGIVFLITLFPSILVAAIDRDHTQTPLSIYRVVPVGLLIAALAYGTARVSTAPSGATIPVGLIAIDAFLVPNSPQSESDRVWNEYAMAIETLSRKGAKTVLLPEKIAGFDSDSAHRIQDRLSQIARHNSVSLTVCVSLNDSGQKRNRLWFFAADGTLTATYDKRHLVPGWEAGYSTGDHPAIVTIQGAPFGLAICRDMDFSNLGREYGRKPVCALLVPAWDFGSDAWMHARMATLQGVAGGFAVIRSSRNGQLTISDRYGRILSETKSAPLPGTTLYGVVPIDPPASTIYSWIGDLFGWFCGTLIIIYGILVGYGIIAVRGR